jgi:hypothetical protein
MKEPSPTLEELEKKAVDLRESAEKVKAPLPHGGMLNNPYFMEPDAWFYIIDLIYSGNGNSAWTFLDMYWVVPPEDEKFREKQREKREFISTFKKQLAKSLYWKDIKVLNSWH